MTDKVKKLAPAILAEIGKSQKVLLACHLGPDGDSVSSNLAFFSYLRDAGKDVELVSPDQPSENFDFLPGYKAIIKKDLSELDPGNYDLFIALDIPAWGMVTKKIDRGSWDSKIIVIDHHATSPAFGDLNLIDPQASCTAEMLYRFFQANRIKISKDISQCLLSAIFAETGEFRYSNTSSEVLDIASALLKSGASIFEISFNLDRRMTLENLRYIGLVLSHIKVNKKLKYVWSVISKEDLKRQGIRDQEAHGATSRYMSSVEGTEFGFLLEELSDGWIYGQMRSRKDANSLVISKILGGGGHKVASGFRFPTGNKLREIERKVHETIRVHYSEIFQERE